MLNQQQLARLSHDDRSLIKATRKRIDRIDEDSPREARDHAERLAEALETFETAALLSSGPDPERSAHWLEKLPIARGVVQQLMKSKVATKRKKKAADAA